MNKDILFLRAPKQDDGKEDEYHESVAKICGLRPFSIPVIDFNFLNIDLIVDALKSTGCFSALIFTSPRAVEAFAIAVETIGGIEILFSKYSFKNIQIFVVGKATSTAVSKLGLNSEGKDTGCAENLGKYILEQKNYDVFDKMVLFIHGSLARDTLPNLLKTAGVKLKSICVYETVPHLLFLEKFKDHLQRHQTPKFIVFFSPSGGEFYLKLIKELTRDLVDVKVLAIGKTTADWLITSNCAVYGVADQPNPDSLSQCIKKRLEET